MADQPYSLTEITERLSDLKEAIEKAKDQRFEDYNTRLESINKFFRFVLIGIGSIVVVVQVFVGVYQLFSVYNQSKGFEELKAEIYSELGKSKEIPEIELYSEDGEIISNQSVVKGILEIRTAKKEEVEKVQFPFLYDKSDQYRVLRVRLAIKNKGKATAEKIWAIMYTKDPLIPIRSVSYMEKDYTGEEGFDYITGGFHIDGLLPPKIITPINLSIRLSNDFDPSIYTGLYPVIVKINYNTKEILTARFLLRIASKPIMIPFESK